MDTAAGYTIGAGMLALLASSLGGCGKIEQTDPRDAGKARVEARRQQAACASGTAYDRLKAIVFDQAIERHGDGARGGARANLDTLADYSLVRMEDPVVTGWDPALDVTRCKGRLIVQVPPGADRGLGGESRLEADVDYTAQAAADGGGRVYRLHGAEPIVAKLAAFTLASGAYRPPPAIDDDRADPPATAPVDVAQAPVRDPQRDAALERSAPAVPATAEAAGGSGEAAVRGFYAALEAGDGGAASARIVPEKRSTRTYAPDAMTRFYGRLAEPIRLTAITPVSRDAYRVRYRYSAGRSRCDGSAIVRLTSRNGQDLIRSIEALNGC